MYPASITFEILHLLEDVGNGEWTAESFPQVVPERRRLDVHRIFTEKYLPF